MSDSGSHTVSARRFREPRQSSGILAHEFGVLFTEAALYQLAYKLVFLPLPLGAGFFASAVVISFGRKGIVARATVGNPNPLEDFAHGIHLVKQISEPGIRQAPPTSAHGTMFPRRLRKAKQRNLDIFIVSHKVGE